MIHMTRKIILSSLALGLILIFQAPDGCFPSTQAVSSPDSGPGSKMLTFDFSGIPIKYTDEGSGRPMIFLHGFGASSYSWRYLVGHFSKEYRTIAIDMKGFGLSGKPDDNRYSARDQALIIKSFIEKNALHDVILAGNSFGGAVSILTALEFSGPHSPISKMILIDSAGGKQVIPDFIAAMRTPLLNWLLLYMVPPRANVRAILEKVFFDPSKISEEEVRLYASYIRLPGARRALISTARQILPPDLDSLIQRYSEINIPVLLLWGEHDNVVPLSIGKMLAYRMSNAKLVVLPGCGHAPQEECPEQTIKAISDFLLDTQGS